MAITYFNEKSLVAIRESEEQRELEKSINQILLEAIEGLSLQLASIESRIDALEKNKGGEDYGETVHD